MYTYIIIYIPTYIHAYTHTYIHEYIYTYIHSITYIRTYRFCFNINSCFKCLSFSIRGGSDPLTHVYTISIGNSGVILNRDKM